MMEFFLQILHNDFSNFIYMTATALRYVMSIKLQQSGIRWGTAFLILHNLSLHTDITLDAHLSTDNIPI